MDDHGCAGRVAGTQNTLGVWLALHGVKTHVVHIITSSPIFS